MSSLFKQISQISQEAQKQREIVIESSNPSLASSAVFEPSIPTVEAPASETQVLAVAKSAKAASASKKVVPQSGTTAPQLTGDQPHLDMEKLKTIIAEISQMPTNSNGFNVRMSQREMADLEDFMLITLRKQGLKGYEVSMAKLMRYAMRYMFRVHEKEFISALKEVLVTEETLSI